MQPNGVLPSDEAWVLGCEITVRTTLGEEMSGTIFTFDRLTNLLVISELGSRPESVSYRFLKIDCIKEILAAEPPSEMTKNALEFVRLEDCIRREDNAVREIELRRAPGVHVVEAGQQLFTKLSEGYHCTWEGRTINVDNKVFVEAPYSIADFRSAEEHSELKDILRLMVCLTNEYAEEGGLL